ncbi:O-methyltransferase [Yinghuangia soli]|uniref:O-methyltransferase n=1 Tax=Yinghuangia soli TaxID=2908204 RepID=UPI0035563742
METVELDAGVAARARDNAWPEWVRFHLGDAVELLPGLGVFDLVYADSPGGKWFGLELTIAALGPRGVLLVDDMTPEAWWSEEHRAHQAGVREALVSDPRLVVCELDAAGGLILATRVG